MKNRKYVKSGESPKAYECTNKKCKWIGTTAEKTEKEIGDGWRENVCPKCGNNEFYGLSQNPIF
ncbi:hypothetical protein [Flavobacterium sp. UBA4197]|uniref:hypothetical protein n=1 Tax=Flavobacterium sp. UBA4197 TaxID=1946546 RepID=UPI002579C9C0|nr:hypothetical protein [Flavobacterium sp. UBA4197]